MASPFYLDQITTTQAQILTYQTAIDYLIANPTKSYSLDTGQTKQTVNRQDLGSLQNQLTLLYSRLEALNAKCNGGVVISRPGW